uniref:LNS2 domain-containing protein n=1 Tax=Globodera pallida TaxID=36090 RepID=A0A183CEZ1_GLOPA
MVVFRLGRLLEGSLKGPGIVFLLPFIDQHTQVDLRVRSYDVPSQEMLTKDSVTVSVDAAVYFRTSDPVAAISCIMDSTLSTKQLAQTTLRNILGTRTLTEIMLEREGISKVIQKMLDEGTTPWGIKVERVELKDIRLPKGLLRALAVEAEAARGASARVVSAEGELNASGSLRNAADHLSGSAVAIHLRFLQTLARISTYRNHTYVVPIPAELLRKVLGLIKHKFNATVKKAIKHVKVRGASDFIVIKYLPDGTLSSTPLFVHFGSGIFPEKGQRRPEGLPVEMTVNGKMIDGMELRTNQNGIVDERKVNLNPLVDILGKKGRYSVRFSVEDWKGRTLSVDCFLYYWDSTTKLVVSDIDGTVTKSDLWGMILGKAWIQRDVRSLYGRIKQRGYKVLYLSARPASVGTLTRKFLRRLKMPSGPLLLSPEPLGKALKTAIKDPQRIKVSCMQRLKDLYNEPRGDRTNIGNISRRRGHVRRKVRNPFFAAFGNQPSDKLAYEMLSVQTMFMVNPRGVVTVYGSGGPSVEKGKSYRYIIDHMDNLFPRLG